MLYQCALLSLLLLTSFCQQLASEELGGVQYSLANEGRKWKTGDTFKNAQQEVISYILDSETPATWTELFTVQMVNGLKSSPEQYFNLFIKQLKTLAPGANVESKILSQSSNELLGEWWIVDQSPELNQHEWMRILINHDNLIALRFTTKKPQPDTTKPVALLKQAQVK